MLLEVLGEVGREVGGHGRSDDGRRDGVDADWGKKGQLRRREGKKVSQLTSRGTEEVGEGLGDAHNGHLGGSVRKGTSV